MAEANKDEIVKCVQVAKDAIRNGDEGKAARFLAKAERMGGEVCSIDELKAQVGDRSTPVESSMPDQNSGLRGESNVRQTAAASSNTATNFQPRTERVNKDGKTYTSEQMSLVQRVLRTRDYYEILQVPRDAPEDVMKKAYKKIALKLHPDKNQAPGAEEAFKKVSKALQCLSNSQHRAAYDQYGDEEKIPRARRHYDQGDFMTPEDLFNQFFGGGLHRTQYHGQGQGEARNPLIQFLPFIFLIVISLLSNSSSFGSSPTPQFSFKGPSMTFRYTRTTRNIGATYYVKSDFASKYPPKSEEFKQFERQVEYYYIQNVNSECDHEEAILINKIKLAKRYGRQVDPDKMSRASLKSCRELERVKMRHPRLFDEAFRLY